MREILCFKEKSIDFSRKKNYNLGEKDEEVYLMRDFNYSLLKDLKWDSEIVSYLTAIHEAKGKQELYLKQQPEKLNKLVEIAKVQSTESSNDIEGIRTTNTRLKQLLSDKTMPKNRDEEEIAGYRDVLNVIHESFEYSPMTANYILQLHIQYLHWLLQYQVQ